MSAVQRPAFGQSFLGRYPFHDMRAHWFREREMAQVGPLPLLEDQTTQEFFRQDYGGHRAMCDEYNRTHAMTYLGCHTWLMNARQAAWRKQVLLNHDVHITLCCSYKGNQANAMQGITRLPLCDMNEVTQRGAEGFGTLCDALVAVEKRCIEGVGVGYYCRNGCHRSGQFAVAHQMARYKLSLQEAWQRVKRLRSLVELTVGRDQKVEPVRFFWKTGKPCGLSSVKELTVTPTYLRPTLSTACNSQGLSLRSILW